MPEHASPSLSASNILDGSSSSFGCTSNDVDVEPDYFQVAHTAGSFGFSTALVHITALGPFGGQEYFLPAIVYSGTAGVAGGTLCGRLPGHEPITDQHGFSQPAQSYVVRCNLNPNDVIKIATDADRLSTYYLQGNDIVTDRICVADVQICEET